ncbi:transmembrane protein, putative, partial [Bodo saltans]
AFLAVTTNDAKYALWNTSASLSEVRGASVVRIDGCTFKNTTTPIFGNAVLWTQVGNKRPTVSLGCNQRSEPTASALFRTVVRADVLGRTTTSDVVGSPIITFGAGDTTPFSSPFLPHVVCNALQPATITESHLPPTQTTPPSSIATSTNILVTTVMFVQVSMPVSSVAATLIHSIQATTMIRRKRVVCGEQIQIRETTSSSNDDSENSLCCDFGTSPTQLTIGDEDALLMRKFIGALVGNTILVFGGSLLKGLVARVLGPHLPTFLQYLLGRPLGPIATVWGPLMTFLSPTLSAAVAIIFLPSTSSGFVPLGIVFICALSIPWVVSFYGLCWRRNQPYPLRGLPPKGRLQRNFKQKLLEPNELLDAPIAVRRYARQLLRAYGPVIDGYTARCYWYFNVETLFAFMNGIVMGLAYNEAVRTPCSMWTDWLLYALGVLEPTVALVVRPFAVLLDVVGLVLVVGLSTLSQLVMLVTSPNDAAADSVADVLALISIVVELLLVVFGLICVAVVGPSRWVHILTSSATDEIAPHASQSTASRYRLIAESTDAGQLPLRRQPHRRSASSSQRHSLVYLTEEQQHHALQELLRLIVEP